MKTTVLKKFKLGLISLSAFTILAACNDSTDQLPDTETPDDTTEDVTDDTNGNGETTDETTDEANDDSTADDTGTTDASAGILSMSFQVLLEDAVQTFHDTFGENVNIDEIEFEDDNGEYYYDFQGWDDSTEYDLKVSADSGEILKQETEADNDPDDDILDITAYITPEEAMNAAVEVSDTDVVDSWQLEMDDGRAVYEIDFEGARDVDIDAVTGEVLN